MLFQNVRFVYCVALVVGGYGAVAYPSGQDATERVALPIPKFEKRSFQNTTFVPVVSAATSESLSPSTLVVSTKEVSTATTIPYESVSVSSTIVSTPSQQTSYTSTTILSNTIISFHSSLESTLISAAPSQSQLHSISSPVSSLVSTPQSSPSAQKSPASESRAPSSAVSHLPSVSYVSPSSSDAASLVPSSSQTSTLLQTLSDINSPSSSSHATSLSGWSSHFQVTTTLTVTSDIPSPSTDLVSPSSQSLHAASTSLLSSLSSISAASVQPSSILIISALQTSSSIAYSQGAPSPAIYISLSMTSVSQLSLGSSQPSITARTESSPVPFQSQPSINSSLPLISSTVTPYASFPIAIPSSETISHSDQSTLPVSASSVPLGITPSGAQYHGTISASQWTSPSASTTQPAAHQWTSTRSNSTSTTSATEYSMSSSHNTIVSQKGSETGLISASSTQRTTITQNLTISTTKPIGAFTTPTPLPPFSINGNLSSTVSSQRKYNVSSTNSAQWHSASIVPNNTRSEHSSQAQESVAAKYTTAQPLVNITATGVLSTLQTISSSVPSSSDAVTSQISSQPDLRPSKFVAPASVSTTTPTNTAAASAPPPLNKPQTAGIAVASATGLFLAVVAAIFLARRYHARNSRRSSTGSIYPKIAYLYDPVTGGPGKPDDNDDFQDTTMSGGSGGLPPGDQMSTIPPLPVRNFSHRHSNGSVPLRFSDPGNPFRDPECSLRDSGEMSRSTLLAPSNAAAALSAAIAGYVATPQKSPTIITTPPIEYVAEQASIVSPTDSDAISPARSSILGEIASMAYNPRTFQNSSARYQPLSPFGYQPSRSLPSLRENCYTYGTDDSFEHDLLLQVDTDTETPDYATVYAPPVTPRIGFSAITPTSSMHNNNSTHSFNNVPATKLNSESFEPLVKVRTTTPESMETCVDTLMDDKLCDKKVTPELQSSPRIVVSSTADSNSPAHRGWDDIKRFSVDKVVPASLTTSPSLISLSPPPPTFIPASSPISIRRKAQPHLRRKEPALAGNGQAMLSSSRLPLTIKVPFTHKRGSKSESRLSNMFRKSNESIGKGDDNIKKPASSMFQGDRFSTSTMHRKKSDTFDFSCAGV